MNWYEDDKLWETFYEYMFDDESFELAQHQCMQFLANINHEVSDVLDLACGPGRHSLALAKLGYKVTGVDISSFLLNKAQQKTDDLNLPIDLVKSDMLEFERENQFDLIINMFNSFGYLSSHKKNQKVLDLAFKNLKKTGTLVIDTIGKEALANTIQPVHLTEYEDNSLRIERPFLSDNLELFNNEWILIKKDEVFRRSYQHYVYTPLELTMMCEKAGFKSIDVFGSLNGDAYDLNSEQMIVIAEKY